MKVRAGLFLIGFALLLIHYFLPGLVPYDVDFIAGLVVLILATFIFFQWIFEGTKGIPAVEYFEPTTEDLREATPEILYLLEEEWGIKKIVDMISSNYQLPPKMVYEHVLEVMSSRQEAVEAASHAHANITMSKKVDYVPSKGKVEITHGFGREEDED